MSSALTNRPSPGRTTDGHAGGELPETLLPPDSGPGGEGLRHGTRYFVDNVPPW